MDNMKELNLNEMENVSGGRLLVVNTGIEGVNAVVRKEPRKDSGRLGSLPNGRQVDVDVSTITYDPASGRSFVKINYNGKTGWVASSLVGLPR